MVGAVGLTKWTGLTYLFICSTLFCGDVLLNILQVLWAIVG